MLDNLRKTCEDPVLDFKMFLAAFDTVLFVNKLDGEFSSFSVIS